MSDPITPKLSTHTPGETDYVAKMNADNGVIGPAVDALQTGKQDLSAKGAVNGYAGLGSDGKVPSAQLPDLTTLQSASGKNAPNGYPGLNAGGYLVLGPLVIAYGVGSPQGVVAAPVGSLYLRTDGSGGTTLYVKESGGGGNTGWTAK